MTDPVISVVVAEDQPLVRAGIAMLLTAQDDLSVVGEAGDGATAVALARRLRPDVVLMDLQMATDTDGVDATAALAGDDARATPVKVLVLTSFNEEEKVRAALRAGASGYVLKHAAPGELATAIRRVAAGDMWIDPVAVHHLVPALRRLTEDSPQHLDETVARLTRREREVLVLMARGLSNQEICRTLVLSEATVKTHVGRILVKTGSRDRTQAVVLAYRSKLVTP